MPDKGFHPAVRAWFEQAFAGPTAAQRGAWPAIQSGRHTLIAAPTGSGKTLAAFLAVIDRLVRAAREEDLFGRLEDRIEVVYVSPLKALSNDIHRNLEAPLQGIREQLLRLGQGDVVIRSMVRTGDTPQGERERMRRRPPHILVTTPESLNILLTSQSGRVALSSARTLIVDEIHALVGNKRGAHLALSMARLEALCASQLTRIGLSATQRPLEEVARFLTGHQDPVCAIVDVGHGRERDLAIELAQAPLEPIMSTEVWGELYERMAELIRAHRTTLLFVNTRRLAERVSKALAERLGEEAVSAHHGSLSREHRLDIEQRLKRGGLRALVATASLELGIDIGDVDLVCQIASPGAISVFLQRVGRSGHALGATPKGRLFPTSLDELVECVALLDAVGRGELEALKVPDRPMDVLAQQIVAEVACREWDEDALFELIRCAWPYRELGRGEFDAVVDMLARGFSTRRGRRGAWLHRDRVNGRLRARRGARLAALLNGGTIPDLFDYDVILQPAGVFVGTLNEDFAFESLPGDIFQLGNSSYKILKTERGRMYVEDAHGQPPNIPFWFGEAPGRSDELSLAVSRLREDIDGQIARSGLQTLSEWLVRRYAIEARAASELAGYLGAARSALGGLPTQDSIVLERFFDEAGDQHLVIHSPFGSRLNRAWGLALRKRFCRKFNFELQAAALEDTIVLSLGVTHSFPLEEVASYLNARTVRELLIQAMLDAPMFATHWRWNASIALAVQRNRSGGRVPAQFQRMDAEDLMAVVFPDQLACLENIVGRREIPDHPLVAQTIADCLHDVMDIEGLEAVLARMDRAEVRVLARDLAAPSPLAQGILAARPYAFLDDAPAEERRTQMVQARRFTRPEDAAVLGVLDPEAIARVCAQAWPQGEAPDELHDALLVLGVMTEAEGQRFAAGRGVERLQALTRAGRATILPGHGERPALWVSAERLAQLCAVHPDVAVEPQIRPLGESPADREAALVELVRGRLEGCGPVTEAVLAAVLGVAEGEIQRALAVLQGEGFVMQGRFSPGAIDTEWCERGLLARIHRLTLQRLREQVQPVSHAAFMRFLLRWQGMECGGEAPQGEAALARVLGQLEGVEAPAEAWEAEILRARIPDYDPAWLDRLCVRGQVMWARLRASGTSRGGAAALRATPMGLLGRANLDFWRQGLDGIADGLSSPARRVLETLDRDGASFFDEILVHTGLLRSQVEQALAELAARGRVSSDSYSGLRVLLMPAARRRPRRSHGRRLRGGYGLEDAGRWCRVREAPDVLGPERVQHIASVLLRRYGVVFRALLAREAGLPPWRELLQVYRIMEARGELRGGRFVEGYAGEQFALPEAIGALRGPRRGADEGIWIVISAADPLNLVGVVSPGARVPALTANRVLYRDGIPVAARLAGKVSLFVTVDQETRWQVHEILLRRPPAVGLRRSPGILPDGGAGRLSPH
jgi:ATP-dependent Lhr-like helicase